MDPTSGALAIAALSVIVTGITALVAPWWARKTERERWNNEREGEAVRWSRQEGNRRTQRGEDAALELIGVVDKAASQMRTMAKYQQSEFASFYRDIRRLSLLLTDDDARTRLLMVGDGLYFFNQIEGAVRNLSRWQAGEACAAAAHDVLRAYLLGRRIPPTPRLDRLSALINEGGRRLAVDIGEDQPDALDEPHVSETVENAEGSGSA